MMRTITTVVKQRQYKYDPSSWVLHALFPQRNVEDVEDLRPLNADQEKFYRTVKRHVDDYLGDNRPLYNSICIYLAALTLHRSVVKHEEDMGCWYWAGDSEALLYRLFQRGIGTLEYVRSNDNLETLAVSEHLVLFLEGYCVKENLKEVQHARDGFTISFSMSPIKDAVFDNTRFIPSHLGFYSIVS